CLGLDPGLAATGWAVVEWYDGKPGFISFGVLKTERMYARKTEDIAERCKLLREQLEQVIDEHSPHAAALEAYVSYKKRDKPGFVGAGGIIGGQVQATLRGVCEQAGLDPVEYPTQSVKWTLCKSRVATKGNIQDFLMRYFGLTKRPTPQHASD